MRIIITISYCLALSLTVWFLIPPILAQTNASLPTIANPFDNLQVKIPGMKRFSDALVTKDETTGQYKIQTAWIAEYLAGLYGYIISIVGILAAMTFIIGAVIYLTSAGNASRVGEAKSWMISSVFGLILALSSYLILYLINPALVTFRGFNLTAVNNGSDPGDYQYNSNQSYKQSPFGSFIPGLPYSNNKYQITCPPIDANLTDFTNYYTYQKYIQYSKSAKRGTCQGGANCYFDCSSFAQYLAMCLKLNAIAGEGTTYSLFITANNNRRLITNLNQPPDTYLKPGDIIGYNDGGVGHVLTYIGNQQLLECGGEPPKGSVIKSYGCIKLTEFYKRISGYKNVNLYYINR